MRSISLIGKAIHRLSRRPPIGVRVRSTTSANAHFSREPFEEKSLQVADREFIDPNVILLVDTRNGRNMGRILMFGKFEVVENGPCRRNAAAELFDTKALERLSAELLAEPCPG